MRQLNILIVGGGVIGLSIARELALSGIKGIGIVERGLPARGATHAAGGMLAPNAENEVIDDFYRLCDASRQMFPELSERLLDETGIDIELDRSGTLYTAFTDDDLEHIEARYARQIAAGIPVEKLSERETLEAEPALSPHVRGSLYFPNDWQVENRRFAAALEASVTSRGVEIIREFGVTSVVTEGARAVGVSDGVRSMGASTVILAAGSATSQITVGGAALPFSVRPIRGQMVCFGRAPQPVRRVIYSPRGYIIPRHDGRILAGSTSEDVGFDDAVTPAGLAGIRHAAFEICSTLADQTVVSEWAGLRPFIDGGQPFIGPVAEYDRLFAATGHFRNGILLAPITAKLIADMVKSA